jgi:hypothetical protein
MKNAPWNDVFDTYAKLSGLTLITISKPGTGTFTFDPPPGKEYTLAEITDIINEALTQEKYILIRRHMTFFLQPADEKIDPTLVPRVSVDELDGRGRTELVQAVLLVKGGLANDVLPGLQKLLTPYGSMVALGNDMLVVLDTAGNIARLKKLLDELAESKKK